MSPDHEESATSGDTWTRRLFRSSRLGVMYASGFCAVGSAVRLVGGHLGAWMLWLNVLVLVAGVIGFAVAAFKPSLFDRDT